MFSSIANMFANSNNIFDKIMFFFFDTISQIFLKIVNFFTAPIMAILNSLIPNFNSYFGQLLTFLNDYVFKGFQFAKMVFINFFGINQNIFTIVFILSIISVSIFFATRGLKFALNLWSIQDNGKTKN